MRRSRLPSARFSTFEEERKKSSTSPLQLAAGFIGISLFLLGIVFVVVTVVSNNSSEEDATPNSGSVLHHDDTPLAQSMAMGGGSISPSQPRESPHAHIPPMTHHEGLASHHEAWRHPLGTRNHFGLVGSKAFRKLDHGRRRYFASHSGADGVLGAHERGGQNHHQEISPIHPEHDDINAKLLRDGFFHHWRDAAELYRRRHGAGNHNQHHNGGGGGTCGGTTTRFPGHAHPHHIPHRGGAGKGVVLPPGVSELSVGGSVVVVQMFVMSQCGYAISAENALLPLVQEFGDRVYFQLDFIGHVDSIDPPKLDSLHGELEVNDDRWQICAFHHYHKERHLPPVQLPFTAPPQPSSTPPLTTTTNGTAASGTATSSEEKWIAFVTCMSSAATTDYAKYCCGQAKVDFDLLSKCATPGGESDALLIKSFERAHNAGAHSSPTIFVNGRPYFWKYEKELFLSAICLAFPPSVRPSHCDQVAHNG